MEKIENLPEYALEYKYIVCRIVDGKHWFYGAYNDVLKAANAAQAICGFTYEVR